MPSKRIIFMGSKPIGYECLAYLISQRAELDLEIAGILTNRRSEFGNAHDLTALAAAHGIPVLARLNDLPACDIIYSVQYHEILKAEHIDKATQIAVNLHMAPLPEYRGSNQFSFAILENKTEFGTTIHRIDTRIDHGDILFQKRFPIPQNCWVNDLYQLTYNASLHLFRQTLAHIVHGQYQPVAQQLLVAKYGTSLHMRKEMNALKQIDLDWDDERIDRQVRATSMLGFEPPYCIIGGQKVYFCKEWVKPS
ncbi:formyltransferase family protein [Nemorincola caseinilytica]